MRHAVPQIQRTRRQPKCKETACSDQEQDQSSVTIKETLVLVTRDAANFKPTYEPNANEQTNHTDLFIQYIHVYTKIYYILSIYRISTAIPTAIPGSPPGVDHHSVSVLGSYVRLSNALATKRRTACLSPSNILCQAVSAAASSSVPFWISAYNATKAAVALDVAGKQSVRASIIFVTA